MTEKQKREYEASKRTADLDKREADLNRRELLANAKDILIKKGMSPDLAEFINLTDADSVNSSIEALAKAFQSDVQSGIEERIKGGNPIQKAPETENITMDSIKNMSTKEINDNWNAIQEVLKNQKK
ncbi:MAG: DUF4355 domain-containing protein [Erysipelotrichaceae bacterium]|nr:DUF4355 domain-containing protein [Erysipelotrichaceae bacterium]